VGICSHQFKNWWLQLFLLLVERSKNANRFPSAPNKYLVILIYEEYSNARIFVCNHADYRRFL